MTLTVSGKIMKTGAMCVSAPAYCRPRRNGIVRHQHTSMLAGRYSRS
jgi:hypothetical protein